MTNKKYIEHVHEILEFNEIHIPKEDLQHVINIIAEDLVEENISIERLEAEHS